MLAGLIGYREICQVNYLTNLTEQNHQFINEDQQTDDGIKVFIWQS
jgi:hypothetical protein